MKKHASKMNRPHGHGAYWLYGTHAVTAALANSRRKILRVLATDNALGRLKETSKKPVERIETEALQRLLPPGAVHQGVAAEVLPLEPMDLTDLDLANESRPLLLLDQVTDPHNVGAILRTAAAFDIAAVICPKDHAPQETATLAKSASGALEIMPLVYVTNLVQAMETLKKSGYWLVGLEGEARETIAEANLSGKTALVLGAEGKGMRRLVGEHCDLRVKIPISEKMESLNVSNAAAVALYAIRSAR